eukprot:m.353717 g.353717  ORF g.353717 m.353717 type:complete len:61 (-) comp19906_c3_seq21:1038-1220(-)
MVTVGALAPLFALSSSTLVAEPMQTNPPDQPHQPPELWVPCCSTPWFGRGACCVPGCVLL